MRSILPGLTTCLLLFTSVGATSQTQDAELDSLAVALGQHVKKDTAYLETLITLARKIRFRDFDKSETYFAEAISLGKELADDRRLVRSFNGAGITYGMQDKYSEAIRCFNQGLELALQKNFHDYAAVSYSSLGIVYKRMGEYPLSLQCYNKSLRLSESTNDAEGIASTTHNLGVLFDMMKEPEKALEYFDRALTWYKENNYGEDAARLQSNIANIYTRKGEYDRAAVNYQAALDYYQQNDVRYGMANALANLGWMYYKKQEFEKAEQILQRALALVNNYQLRQLKVSVLFSLSRTKADQGSYSESIRLAFEAKHAADSIDSFKKKLDVQNLLAYVYEKSGDPAKALDHHKQFVALQDSLFNEEKVRSYKSQQVIMEVSEKEKELQAQAAEMTFLSREIAAGNRGKWMLGIACFFLLLAGSVYYQKYRQRRKYSDELETKNQLITLQKAEIEEMNTRLEKRMLRAQMNPHFIFNALSAIQHFITANDKVASLHYLSLFSTMLRQVLETSVNTSMTLKEEIEFLSVYLELEALRFEKGFVYKINVDDNLEIDMLEIPAMIIQPFVENAILHGLMPRGGPRKLTLDVVDGGDHISCFITDNGVGREEAARISQRKMSKRPSRGVFLAQQRLKLFNTDGDPKPGLTYIDLKDDAGKPAGTRVIIDIPKQELL